jgi:hypothetical protein
MAVQDSDDLAIEQHGRGQRFVIEGGTYCETGCEDEHQEVTTKTQIGARRVNFLFVVQKREFTRLAPICAFSYCSATLKVNANVWILSLRRNCVQAR